MGKKDLPLKEIDDLKEIGIIVSGERLHNICSKILSKFRRKEREYSVGSLENKSIAIYLGRDSELLDKAKFKLKQKRAKYINFDMDDRLAGQTIPPEKPKICI